ncbi:hypothetical protein GCM10008959_13770 [Deinococcus seoulensis]|uniref:Transposase n=1 Tax=Deinococcus seoulensis TaxID=1837379 RepID=A0ABQ2RNX7_9DEIO|nr:hypothetical protein GCM10008959_13770 [Deinococcus seoulensis]
MRGAQDHARTGHLGHVDPGRQVGKFDLVAQGLFVHVVIVPAVNAGSRRQVPRTASQFPARPARILRG